VPLREINSHDRQSSVRHALTEKALTLSHLKRRAPLRKKMVAMATKIAGTTATTLGLARHTRKSPKDILYNQSDEWHHTLFNGPA
jgi:hypothetical protein